MSNKMGKKLRKLRGDKSRASVARDLGISVSAVASYELGERVPRDPLKVSISKYYGVPVQEIFF
jgi:putative transcriptional regulator